MFLPTCLLVELWCGETLDRLALARWRRHTCQLKKRGSFSFPFPSDQATPFDANGTLRLLDSSRGGSRGPPSILTACERVNTDNESFSMRASNANCQNANCQNANCQNANCQNTSGL